jgi:hypothetical protein
VSYPTEETVRCPECQRSHKLVVWRSINVTVDPELKDQLLAWEINVLHCDCGAATQLLGDILYHDMKRKLLIQLVEQDENGERRLPQLPLYMWTNLAKDFEFRYVVSRHQLHEKILIAEAGLDDRLIEALKLLLPIPPLEQDESIEPLFSERRAGRLKGEDLVFVHPGPRPDPKWSSIGVDYYQFLVRRATELRPGLLETTGQWLPVDRGFGLKVLDALRPIPA